MRLTRKEGPAPKSPGTTRRFDTLFQRLTLAFLLVALAPVLLASAIGLISFRQAMDTEATRTIDDRMISAQSLVRTHLEGRIQQMKGVAGSSILADALANRDAPMLSDSLETLLGRTPDAYILVVDPEGAVITSSEGPVDLDRNWDVNTREALRGSTGGDWVAVPIEEIVALGRGADAEIEVVATENGTVLTSELEDVLTLSSTVPVRDSAGEVVGALVWVDIMPRSSVLVDEIVAGTDALATVFHHEVRVATTVIGGNGRKAYGTVVSDAVREQVLERNSGFRGEAFVVDRDVFSAYEPITDSSGRTVGMLYVGIPLDPYQAAERIYASRLGVSILLGLLAAIVGGSLMARRISTPIQQLSDSASAIADGDLTISAPETRTSRELAELGRAFNRMTAGLATIARNVSASTDSMRDVVEEISTASTQQAASAAKGAAAITQTTATVEEMAASYRAVAQSAEEVMRLAEDALGSAQQGNDRLNDVANGIERLRTEAEATRSSAEELRESAANIGEVLGIINTIAEQTKILALNAAIEAARAGEAGHGFAVVSTEIRNLAGSVSSSTARIKSLVTSIQSASDGLANTSSQQVEEASESVRFSKDSQLSFETIVTQMASTASAAREIAMAAAQQRSASEQVVASMQDVSAAATETAAAARSVENAMKSGAREIDDLGNAVRGFKI